MQPRQVRRPASAEYQGRAVTTGAVGLREVDDYIRAHVNARTAFGPIGECSALCFDGIRSQDHWDRYRLLSRYEIAHMLLQYHHHIFPHWHKACETARCLRDTARVVDQPELLCHLP